MKQYSVSVRVTSGEFEEPVLDALDTFAKFGLAATNAPSKNNALATINNIVLVVFFKLVRSPNRQSRWRHLILFYYSRVLNRRT